MPLLQCLHLNLARSMEAQDQELLRHMQRNRILKALLKDKASIVLTSA